MGIKEVMALPDDDPNVRLWKIIGPALVEIAQAQIARGAHPQYTDRKQDTASTYAAPTVELARYTSPESPWQRVVDEYLDKWVALGERKERLREQMERLDEDELNLAVEFRRRQKAMGRQDPHFQQETDRRAYFEALLEVSEEWERQCRAEFEAMQARADKEPTLHRDPRFEARYRTYLTRHHDAEDKVDSARRAIRVHNIEQGEA